MVLCGCKSIEMRDILDVGMLIKFNNIKYLVWFLYPESISTFYVKNERRQGLP